MGLRLETAIYVRSILLVSLTSEHKIFKSLKKMLVIIKNIVALRGWELAQPQKTLHKLILHCTWFGKSVPFKWLKLWRKKEFWHCLRFSVKSILQSGRYYNYLTNEKHLNKNDFFFSWIRLTLSFAIREQLNS